MKSIIELAERAEDAGLDRFARAVAPLAASRLSPSWNADIPSLEAIIRELGVFRGGHPGLRDGILSVGRGKHNSEELKYLNELLKRLHPWRKGPLFLGDVFVDTEWRSDWKWQRVCPHISPLSGKVVLDVGCGNGYYALRMALEGARAVVGIEPFILNVFQFMALDALCVQDGVCVLPLGVEDIPADVHLFDTVFSMGLLYHRRDPLAHLQSLRRFLKIGGEVVVETLVLESDDEKLLVPEGRYAGMRNVWNIPSPSLLVSWMRDAGFKDVRIVDVTRTTVEEQRATEWMTNPSLVDYLDPDDTWKTIEGYPAPVRAVVTGRV